ncbi:MAG: hypothetical protein Q7R83_04165 [bacterium]|nr:hypothetical protein [bacterium]
MFQLDDLFTQQPSERVYKILRRHTMTLWPRLIIPGFFIVAPFFFLFHLTIWYRVLLFIFVEAIGLVTAIRTFLIWDGSALIITSHRLCQVDQQGFWQRSVLDTPLQFVSRVEAARMGVLPFLLPFGSLKIFALATEQPIIVRAISKPRAVEKLIQEILERKAWQRTVDGESADLTVRVHNLMDQASEQTVREVEKVLQSQPWEEAP